MEFFYFHNCVYDYLWKNNRRRNAERFPTWDVLRKYPPDTKLIFVGDATMSPYEVLQPGGSVEYNNEEAGADVAGALHARRSRNSSGSIRNRRTCGSTASRSRVIRQIMNNRMFPLTMDGLERAMRLLSK